MLPLVRRPHRPLRDRERRHRGVRGDERRVRRRVPLEGGGATGARGDHAHHQHAVLREVGVERRRDEGVQLRRGGRRLRDAQRRPRALREAVDDADRHRRHPVRQRGSGDDKPPGGGGGGRRPSLAEHVPAQLAGARPARRVRDELGSPAVAHLRRAVDDRGRRRGELRGRVPNRTSAYSEYCNLRMDNGRERITEFEAAIRSLWLLDGTKTKAQWKD
eukprot:gene720-biopygen2202